jgi:uncharacterized Fe-S cluster-containing MiaB family protein
MANKREGPKVKTTLSCRGCRYLEDPCFFCSYRCEATGVNSKRMSLLLAHCPFKRAEIFLPITIDR